MIAFDLSSERASHLVNGGRYVHCKSDDEVFVFKPLSPSLPLPVTSQVRRQLVLNGDTDETYIQVMPRFGTVLYYRSCLPPRQC